MDAHSIVAVGALNTAAEVSKAAAMQELLLERERAAMQVEDLRGFVAARHFLANALESPPAVPETWRQAAVRLGNDWRHKLGVVRAALRDLRQGNPEMAERRLEGEEVSESEEEEDDDEEDALACVICGSSNGNDRYFYNMRAEGRWAGLRAGARVVCSSCHRDDMGEVESFF